MGHKKYHNDALPGYIEEYANKRLLDYHRYSEYHMRLMDGGFTAVDIWTSERYWVMQTDYLSLGESVVERGNEKGRLPSEKSEIYKFLDKLFYPTADLELLK